MMVMLGVRRRGAVVVGWRGWRGWRWGVVLMLDRLRLGFRFRFMLEARFMFMFEVMFPI